MWQGGFKMNKITNQDKQRKISCCLSQMRVVCVASLLLMPSLSAQAETKLGYRMSPPKPPVQANSGSTFSNSTYKDVTVPPHMTRPPLYQQNHPYPPQYPNRPYPPHGQQGYPQQNGVTIIYNQSLPSQTTYTHQSYGYVNGNGGTIESSSYMLISDWRRYGLPDPSVGMHWIYQNGRYLQVPNDR